jgi:glycosyltransferase involved in cell wall biosynthesis
MGVWFFTKTKNRQIKKEKMTQEKKRNSAIVLLVFNEIDGLRSVFDEIPIDDFALTIAVDGGSTDGSRAFLEKKGIPILDQPIPGRGVAFRVAAEALDVERLIFYSPDGNEDPKDILPLDDLLLNGAHLSIASRFAKGAINEETDVLRPRARINKMFSLLANKIFNQSDQVTDTINGFRGIRRRDLLDLDTSVKRFPIEYQISIRAMQRGWNIKEIPTVEGQRAGGESKAISWPVGKDHVRVLLTELYRSHFFTS